MKIEVGNEIHYQFDEKVITDAEVIESDISKAIDQLGENSAAATPNGILALFSEADKDDNKAVDVTAETKPR